MQYNDTNVKYESEIKHYSVLGIFLYITFWLATLIFPLAFLVVVMLKLGSIVTKGILPWPWELFKKGAWIGSCPVCSQEILFIAKPTIKEINELKCDCGASCKMINGDRLVYKIKN